MIFTQLVNGWTFQITTVCISLLKGAIFPTIVVYTVIGLDKLISDQYHAKWKKLFEEGKISDESPKVNRDKERLKELNEAANSLNEDPNVKHILENLGGQIIKSSIKSRETK